MVAFLQQSAPGDPVDVMRRRELTGVRLVGTHMPGIPVTGHPAAGRLNHSRPAMVGDQRADHANSRILFANANHLRQTARIEDGILIQNEDPCRSLLERNPQADVVVARIAAVGVQAVHLGPWMR
jgi:hypothetical protein